MKGQAKSYELWSVGPRFVAYVFYSGVDPALLASALADDVDVDESALENDPDLLVRCVP